jgi:hypothetical protein
MIVYTLTALTILLPAAGMFFLVKARPHDRREWFLCLAVASGPVLFSVLAGSWAVIGTDLRPMPIMLFLACGFMAFRRIGTGGGRPARFDGTVAIRISVIILFSALNINMVRPMEPPEESWDVRFPLQRGEYLVLQGGSGRIGNFFHALQPGSRYALDIVKLGERGRRARGILPGNPSGYCIYGEPVYCPVDGEVVEAEDGMPDDGHQSDTGRRGEGNHVLLESEGRVLLVAHLAKGSVRVKKGDTVKKGQPLGRVGNSGKSGEPHLHVHAERRDGGGPVPLVFNGRSYSINDMIVAE